MKYNDNSPRLDDAQLQKHLKTSTSHPDPLQLRLETAHHIVECLEFAESAVEYQLLMRELRNVLAPS